MSRSIASQILRTIPLNSISEQTQHAHMWTCQVVKNGETYLGRHLVANDYYDEGNQVVGRWVGRASSILGIEGQEIHSGDTHFENLRTNTHPTLGGLLTQRTGEDRRALMGGQRAAPFGGKTSIPGPLALTGRPSCVLHPVGDAATGCFIMAAAHRPPSKTRCAGRGLGSGRAAGAVP